LIRRQSIVTKQQLKEQRDKIFRRQSIISQDYRTEPSQRSHNIVVLNVRGNFYEVFQSTLHKYKDTLLGSEELREYYDRESGEHIIDTDPQIFYTILHFYQTNGHLYCPPSITEERFLEEIKFFRLTKYFLKLNDTPGESSGDEENARPKKANMVWTFLEKSNSSVGARIWSYCSIVCILMAVTIFMVETIPEIEEKVSDETTLLHFVFFCIETTCIAFFTLEFILRAFACPQFIIFVKNVLNWVDFISILPYYIGLIFPGGIAHIFVVLRVLRVVRVLRLARHSDGIKIIFLALSTSVSELFFLIFFWSIAIIFFGSLIHYVEGIEDKDGNYNAAFDSIPRSAWWVVVTMSSVGYGDCYPITWQGKIIGSLCIMSCMLVLALPMTVIISKVTRTYHAYIQKENRIELRRQMAENKKIDSSNYNSSTAV